MARLFLPMFAMLCLLPLSGCVSTKVKMMGPPLPPISPDDVVLHGSFPPRFREIALVESHLYLGNMLSEQRRAQMGVDSLARAAASVGANGLLIRNMNPSSVRPFGYGYRAFRMGAVENTFAHMTTMHGIAIATP